MEKPGHTETRAYDDANQITDSGFAYDECGNLTSDGEWVYEYDRGFRLISTTNDSENLKVVFGYDPQGMRYSKTAYERDPQGQYTQQKYALFYHYDSGGNILAETDAAGSVIRSYAYDLSGHPVAFTQDLGSGQKTFYIHTNVRGDVVCVTDDTMNWVKKFVYDPWGRITSETASSPEYENLHCPYAYAGYFRDRETGFYYMPARYYSPNQRRFLTKDPHPGSRSNPITLNPYQYCVNNPVNKVDPTGQYDWIAALNTIAGQAASAARAGYNLAAAGAALIREGGRQAAGFASSMAGFRSSVQGSMANMGSLGAAIRSGVSSITAGISKINLSIGVQKGIGILGNVIGAFTGNKLTPPAKGPAWYERLLDPRSWSWSVMANLGVVNIGYSSQGGLYASGGANWPPFGVDASLTYDPNPNNNAGGSTVGGAFHWGVEGGVAYEPGTGDWRFSIGVGTPGGGIEGDRIGD